MKLSKLMLALALTAGGATQVSAEEYVIHAGHMVDVVAGNVKHKVSILVDGKKIKAVQNGYVQGSDKQQVIDLKDYTVMPGFIDLHTHIDTFYDSAAYSALFTKNDADIALNAVGYAKKTLAAGFTTIRNLGGRVSLEVRDAINAGKIEGPRIFAAGGAIASTGGHGDRTNGINKHFSHLMGPVGPEMLVANGPYEAREAVRQVYKRGADVVKVTVTGGVLSLAKSGDNPQFMDDELKAIMDTANDYNFVVAVHAHGAEGMYRAVAAGVHSVEHGTYMTPQIMSLMKEKGTYYVPTLTAGKWVGDNADSYPVIVQAKARTIGPKIQSTFAAAYKAGVKIAFGSDSGVYPHGMNGQEFQLMVNAGMPEIEAIQAATINAATLLRHQDEFGSLASGLFADIVAVKGDPLKNIALLEDVDFVMKEGKIVSHKN